MIGKLIECEADKNNIYYRVIHDKAYKDGRRFPINEVIVSEKKLTLMRQMELKWEDFIFLHMNTFLDG